MAISGLKRFAAGVSPFSDTPIASRLGHFFVGSVHFGPGIGGERLQTLLQTDVVLALGSSEVIGVDVGSVRPFG